MPLAAALVVLARHARWLLLAGLLAGTAFPAAAATLRPLLPLLIGAMLFLSALRISPRHLGSAISHMRHDLPAILVLQLVLPLVFALGLTLFGVSGPLADVLVLMATAAPIAASPALAVICGLDGFAALRLLVWGTVLLPLTALMPLNLVFSDLPGASVAVAAMRLAGLILLSAGAGMAVRRLLPRSIGASSMSALDGLSAILLALLVLALMDAIQPLIMEDLPKLLSILLLAITANIGLQLLGTGIATALVARRHVRDRALAGTLGLIAGNRNIALFLVALPPQLTDQMMVFIGCYQIPMLLTPIVLGPLYRRLLAGR